MGINQIIQSFKLLFVAYLLVRLGFNIFYSFAWPMDGDLSFLYYMSWLMNEQGMVPYSDLHETSMLGTFIFYNCLTALIGYSSVAFHIADSVLFMALALMTYGLMRPFGSLVALLAIGCFGEFYFFGSIGRFSWYPWLLWIAWTACCGISRATHGPLEERCSSWAETFASCSQCCQVPMSLSKWLTPSCIITL